MRILIDTNVFIGREDNKVVTPDLQALLKILSILKAEILIHPKSAEELEKDADVERRKISTSKMAAYPQLESPPDPQQENAFMKAIGKPSNSHDIIDNFMLYAVFKDAVSYLITEDRELQKKAKKVGLQKRVLSCHEARILFESHIPKEKIEHPLALQYVPMHNLDLDDPFFSSLKAEYGREAFAKWFKEKSREGRMSYVHFEAKAISALLVFKDETEAVPCIPPLEERRRLKLCTFKAIPSGYRLGELFIKLSVRYCVKNRIDEMYLTHFTKKPEDFFTKLLKKYGFEVAGKKANGEDVYLKSLIPEPLSRGRYPINEIGRRFYPSFYDGAKVQKFIVPIRPKYHKRLFDDYRMLLRQASIYDYGGGPHKFIVEGNTISKAYLCNAGIRKIKKNDLLLFYRSWDRHAITTLGVVESANPISNSREILDKVRNRTVYSPEEIEKMKKPVLVLLFRWHFYLPTAVRLNKLLDLKILKAAPQTITTIDHEKYLQIKKESKLNGRYTVY